MQRVLLALGAALLVDGCVVARPSDGAPEEPYKPPEDQFNDRWAGKFEDDVLVQYGKPNDVVDLSNGNHVNSYHREAGSSSSYCDRRFEIDRRTLRVVRAVITGSKCDFSR